MTQNYPKGSCEVFGKGSLQEEYTVPEAKIETTCSICKRSEVFIVDIIAAFNLPHLPDIFAVDCKICGLTGIGYQDEEGWKIEWDKCA